ncbi:MAG TPA: YdeI/OmpD-associated family protein [Bacteroidota bacterium]|nr:YdeI/OmpD-associated family protein [Bacteroidota bacterium]
MAKSSKNPKVDFFFNKATKWHEEYAKLRMIALDCGLTEEPKWGCPCYIIPAAADGRERNIVLIHGFKDYCAFLFFKGVLLKDPEGILIQQTKYVQAGRQIRFTSVEEITAMKSILKAYIQEAVGVEESGQKVNYKKTSEFSVPEELQDKFAEMPTLRKAFNTLTPGRQRGYLHYFSQAKQSKTRIARIEKYVRHILKGKGLED